MSEPEILALAIKKAASGFKLYFCCLLLSKCEKEILKNTRAVSVSGLIVNGELVHPDGQSQRITIVKSI